MGSGNPRNRAAIGFTAKSGWAATVLLGGLPGSPRVLDTRRLELADPATPEARQPYHDGFGTARRPGAALSRLVASVERFGMAAVTGLIGEYQAAGHAVTGVGVVVGSLVDPDDIANPHIRIHALEGRLFRRVVEDAARGAGLACSIVRERDLYGRAAETLKRTEARLRAMVSALERPGPGPWRAEQKSAALAAWLVLAGRGAVAPRSTTSTR
jgi:hypothetical protein